MPEEKKLIAVFAPLHSVCHIGGWSQENCQPVYIPVVALAAYEITENCGKRLSVHALVIDDGEVVDAGPYHLCTCPATKCPRCCTHKDSGDANVARRIP
jgi:hypothetical protein